MKTRANDADGAKDGHMTELSLSRFLEEPHDVAPIRMTIWGIVVAVCAFIGWSSVTPVYEVVNGNGQIRPAGLMQKVEHLEGGIVAKVHVEEGDLVEKGEPLVQLDPTAIEAELEKNRSEQAYLRQQISRARAFSLEDPSSVAQLDPTFAAELAFQLAQIEVFRSDRMVLEAELVGLDAEIEKLEGELAILRDRRRRFEQLRERDLLNQNEMENLERDAIRLAGEIRRIGGEREVRQASIKRSHAQEAEMLASLRRDNARNVDELQERLVVATQTIAQLSDRLDRLVIAAPSTGVVQALSVQNAGQVIIQGDAVAEIVPEGSSVFAEVEVSADTINGVAPGRDASLKILTHDFTRFGAINATVDRVSPTSVTLPDGSQVFRVRLTFDDGALSDASGNARRITPGMTVSAGIRTDKRTVLNFLLKPIRVITDRAMSES